MRLGVGHMALFSPSPSGEGLGWGRAKRAFSRETKRWRGHRAPASAHPTPTPPLKGRGFEAGFTLVEALVSLALLGLVAGLLLSGLGMTSLVAARQDRAAQAQDEVAAAQTILRDRLERLRPVLRLDSNRQIIDARGSGNDFSFFATPLGHDAPDAPQRYRLLLTAGGDLMLYSANSLDRRIDLHADNLAGWQPHRLVARASSLSIAYFGADANNGGRRWQQNWSDHSQPPELVRVRLVFAPGDVRRWPELVVRPRATVNAACRIDPLSGRCEGES